MIDSFFDSILSNPSYLAVSIVVITLLAFSAVKKLFKLVSLGLTLYLIYCLYLVFTGQPVPTFESLYSDFKLQEEKLSDTIEENIINPMKEKKETIENNINLLK